MFVHACYRMLYSACVLISCIIVILLLITLDSTRIWDFPFNGMVRLQDGEFVSEGRIEVYCNGQWGTVCDTGITFSSDLDVFCQQLGYSAATITSDASL